VRVTLVAGQPRQGKTTLALAVARREAGRLIVLDPVRSKALRSVTSADSWARLARWLAESPAARGDRWEIALRSDDPADYAATLRYAKHYRHVALLLDEVLTFTSDRDALPWLVRAARASAHFGGGAGVTLYMTAQRPYDIPPDVRACLTRLFVFATREPGDLEYISRFTLDPDLAAQVAGLAPHHYLEFPPTTGRRSEPETLDGMEEKTDESVPDGGTRGGGAARAVPSGSEDQPHSPSPRRAQVERATT
jgi:hypothetical protein